MYTSLVPRLSTHFAVNSGKPGNEAITAQCKINYSRENLAVTQ